MMPANPQTNTSNPLANVDWDDLLDTLDAEKCVLFIGGGAYEAPGGGDIETAIRNLLDAGNPDNPHIRMYSDDGFLLLRKSRFKRRITAQLKEFLNQPFPETEELFGQVAQMPFSMIITLTPDNLLSRTFDTLGFPYQSDFYFRHRKAPEFFERPTKEKPLIYNLLGNIEEPESILLTHGDFFDYLESVFRSNSMNQDMKDELERAERYIFLGLPYEKWYFQLLLRMLSMHSEKLQEVERLALEEFEDPRLRALYTEEFRIEFFPCDVKLFVGELHRQCGEADMLKKVPPPDPTLANLPDLTFEQFQELIARAETAEAMRHLKALLDRRKPRSLPLINDLVVLQNRYNLLRQREMRGTILPQDLSVENNQVVEQLLELIARV